MPSPATSWTDRLLFGAGAEFDEARRRWFRARQLQSVIRLTPLAMFANVMNAVLVCAAFWDRSKAWFLVPWFAALLAVVWRGSAAWLRTQRHGPPDGVSARAVRRAELQAVVLAILWGLPPLLLFANAAAPQQLLIAGITTGMIGAGGFVLATVPTAGTAYVLVLSLGGAAGLARSDVSTAGYIAVLLIVYGVTVIGSVWSTAATFTARLVAEAEAASQHEVIGLLLRDFEEHSSDVLFDTDTDGRLTTASSRLSDVLGLPQATLVSAPLVHLLADVAPPNAEAAAQVQALDRHLRGAAPFRDAVVPGLRDGQVRYWSLSAKPRHEPSGRQAGWRGVVSDITDAYLANQRLTWLAHNDSLTGLGNRHQFRTQLARLLAHAPASDPSLAVIYVDLDHFKSINESLGHAAGDAVLRLLGERMLAIVRRSDMVARLGGDEFAVLLSSISRADEVEQFSRRLLAVINEPCDIGGHPHRVRCSLGVALAPRDGRDVDTLLNHADLALYAAKSGGRHNVRFYTVDMEAGTRRRVAIENGLRDAVSQGEFHLAYQPTVSVRNQSVLGFETLLRWRHPELADVSPAEFVAIAEASGQMAAIGPWVLETACLDAIGWPSQVRLAVNVSPTQAASAAFAEQVLEIARRTGLAPERLELEITESALLADTEATVQAMRALRSAGCHISLDDFGTGHSALSYLRQFPFDALKIDRSLISGLEVRADAQAIVRMIVGMAQALMLNTVAEGVDELSQLDALSRFGCDAAQGHAISPPIPAADVPAFIAAHTPVRRGA